MAAQKAPSASAIAFTPTGTVAATNVQDAIAEVASEAAGGGGASPVTVVGPYTKTYVDFNAAGGDPIPLGSAFSIGQIVEPFAFFPTYFDGGDSPHEIDLTVKNPAHGNDSGAIFFDSNAPNDANADFMVSGLYGLSGEFPRRTLYHITAADVQLVVAALPTIGQTRGSIVIYAFVWTPDA